MNRFFIIMLVVFIAVSCDSGTTMHKIGDTGDTGDTANTGDTGNTGDIGNSGNTADTGNTGDSGDTVTDGGGDTGTDNADSGEDADTGDTEPDEDNADPGDCATQNLGKSCDVDPDCGKCMICTTGGKCNKGCMSNDDCTMATGLRCNKKLARCTNVYASLQACGETKCPEGCCYGEKGLTAVKCQAVPEASKCGKCAQSEIYIPSESKCVSAVCSTITDNCPVLNAASTDPKPACFKCRTGEFICKADAGTSGCSSAGLPVNVATCTPAGQECINGAGECCSGMPCIQGYCY